MKNWAAFCHKITLITQHSCITGYNEVFCREGKMVRRVIIAFMSVIVVVGFDTFFWQLALKITDQS